MTTPDTQTLECKLLPPDEVCRHGASSSIYRRWLWHNDAEYREHRRKQNNEYQRRKRANNQEYVLAQREVARKRRLDPNYRAKERIQNKQRRSDPETWIHFALRQARHRAKKFKIEFSITQSDINVVLKCPVLGLILEYGGSKSFNPASPSLDRVENSRGYVPGNVRIISLRANLLKKDATLDELRNLLRYVEESIQLPR